MPTDIRVKDSLMEEESVSGLLAQQPEAGVLIYSPEEDRYSLTQNSEKQFTPASTTKILTSLFALGVLGESFRFSTDLKISGYIDQGGTLHGDLYIVGSGDPDLTLSDLRQLSEGAYERGLRKVTGNIYYDDSYLPKLKVIDPKQHGPATYNPGVSALSSESNIGRVEWSTQDGETVVYPVPNFSFKGIQLGENATDLDDSGWLHLPYPAAESGRKYFPVYNPSQFTGRLMTNCLAMSGVHVAQNVAEGVAPPGSKLLLTHRSKKLSDLISIMMEPSDNLMAELILLRSAREIRKKSVSLKESGKMLADWAGQTYSLPSEMILPNGSGLGFDHRMTPLQLMNVLQHAPKHFFTFLPVAGIKGTLKRRMFTPDSALRVWAKTGTMFYTSAVAGKMLAASGKPYLFVLFDTDFKARYELDSLSPEDAGDPQVTRSAVSWLTSSRSWQDRFIASWIREN